MHNNYYHAIIYKSYYHMQTYRRKSTPRGFRRTCSSSARSIMYIISH